METWSESSPSSFIYSTEAGNSSPAVDTAGFEDPRSGHPASYLFTNLGNSILDTDGDGVEDGVDNCPNIANADQANFDGDAAGDACDSDDDNDGLDDVVETGTSVFIDANNTGTDPRDADSDDDGVSDGDEVAAGTDPNVAGTGTPEVPMLSPWSMGLVLILLVAIGLLGLS
ncbi:MAG: thrombospondin type 3 repeat-containing protein [Myxococcota bacterium]